MSKQIGIIGAGTAGLHLGLYLRQHDVEATIITDRAPEAYAGARLPNTVAHHAVTIERERALGVDHWPGDEYGYFGHHYYIGLQPDHGGSTGTFTRPAGRWITASTSRD